MKRLLVTYGRSVFCAAAVITGLLPAPVPAQTESLIHSFQLDIQPQTGLLYRNGHLYGTTPFGGTGVSGVPGSNAGTVYSLTIPPAGQTQGTRKVLYNFIGNSAGTFDGAQPYGRLIAGPQGSFFGTTSKGGALQDGAVFKLSYQSSTQTWTETILYSFQGNSDGVSPVGGLAMDAGGNLYGATTLGGTDENGTVFMLSPPAAGQSEWTEAILYRFAGGADGASPNGDLLLDTGTGALFGTTFSGGSGLGVNGTVFSLTPTGGPHGVWTKSTLWNFDNSNSHPNGGLLGATGALFGTTQNGDLPGDCCGGVFFLWQEIEGNPQYTLKVLHQFTGGADGATPLGGLFEDASRTFWGTTSAGGTSGLGTIFKLAPDPMHPVDWDYSLVYSFQGAPADGATPEGPMTADGSGALYGVTSSGGTANHGAVYKLTP